MAGVECSHRQPPQRRPKAVSECARDAAGFGLGLCVQSQQRREGRGSERGGRVETVEAFHS